MVQWLQNALGETTPYLHWKSWVKIYFLSSYFTAVKLSSIDCLPRPSSLILIYPVMPFAILGWLGNTQTYRVIPDLSKGIRLLQH